MKDKHRANERQVNEVAQLNQCAVAMKNGKTKYKKGTVVPPDSEHNVTTSTDSDNDCAFLFDAELNCIDISKSALHLFPGGTRKKDVIGKHLLDISPDLKETGRYSKYVEVLKTGIPISDAINVPGPKFAVVGFDAHIYRVKDGLGITVNFSTDIRELEQVVEEIREADKLYRSLVEGINDIVYVLDEKAVVTYVSPAIESIIGYSASEIIGRNISEYICPEDLLLVIQRFQSGSFVNMPGPFEFRILTKSDEVRWVRNMPRTLLRKNRLIGYQGVLNDITDHKRAEEELQYSEQKIRNLFESVGDGLCLIDLNGIYTEVNNKLCEMQGFSSREEILGKNAFDSVAPRDIERARFDAQRHLEKGSIELQEYTNIRIDSSEYPVEVSSTLLKDISGNPSGFIASVRDISERKKVEEALRESQEILRTVFDSIGDGITVLDLGGTIVDVNQTVLSMKGYNREDVIGRFGLDFVAEKDHARATEEMMALFSGEVEHTPATEYALITKDGSHIPCEASASLLRDGSGNVVGLISVERDLRERKRVEGILRESEEHYRMLVETSPHGIQENDISGVITFGNRALHEILGYEMGELNSKYIWDLLAIDDRKEELKAYFNTLVSDQPLPVPYVVKNRTKDGRIIDVQVDWNYKHDARGQLVGFVNIITDITERKRAEEMLKESEDLLKQAEKLAGIGSWQWNLRDNTFSLSEGMRFLYGTEVTEFNHIMDLVETLIHPDDREEVYKAAEVVTAIGSGKTLVYRVIRPNGEVRWINATVPEVRRFGEDGKPEIMLGAVQDITERKQAEQEIREREERWKLFSESATDVFTIWDSKLNLIDNPDRSVQTFYPPGTRLDDLIGKNILEFIPDEEKDGRYCDYLNVIKTGEPYFADDVVPHHKFGDRLFSIKAFKVGEGLGTIVTDITEQKRAEHRLQESEERLRSFMESATDIFNIWDSNLDLVYTPEKGIKEFFPPGTRKEDILGKNLLDIVPDLKKTNRYDEYLKVVETGKPFFAEDVVPSAMFGHRHISIKAFKSGNDMGQVITDITRQKQAEEQLHNYAERIRLMAKQLSEVEESQRRSIARELHDNVGQNLTVLGINFSKAKAQMARGKIEEVQSMLDDSQQLLEQTTDSVRNVMADLRPPVLEDYGLLAALRWYGDRFSSRNEIYVTVQGEEPTPRLGIEVEIVLFRIAQEALTNIAKHAKASNVTMNFNKKDGRQRLEITDDGVGFDTGELSKYREQTSWGLVTMSERAQSIGGSLCIESHPGGGTQIIVEVTK